MLDVDFCISEGLTQSEDESKLAPLLLDKELDLVLCVAEGLLQLQQV